jgi:hypothetical protein
MNKSPLFVLLLLLAACSSTKKQTSQIEVNTVEAVISQYPALTTELYYSRCMSRYKNKSYINLEKKCSCQAKLFPRKDLSFIDKSDMCRKYNVREGEQIVQPSAICESTRDIERLKVGMLIQLYRWYEQIGWVEGVMKKHKGNLWRIGAIKNDGVELELLKGEHYSHKIGDYFKFSNSPLYKIHFPDADSSEQVVNSHRECINPKL